MFFRILRKFVSVFLCLSLTLFLVGNSVFAQVNSDEERKVLEEQLAQIEKQIDAYETTVDNYHIKGRSLESEISRLNAQMKKINLQIQATNISLKRLDREIINTQDKINVTETKLDLNKGALRESLRKINESDGESLMIILLKNPSLANFFTDMNDLLTVQDSIRITVNKVEALHDDLLDQNQELSLERTDVSALKKYQVAQHGTLKTTSAEKDNILKVTKGQESKYQALLRETQKTAAQIRSRIFEFLGGGELSFEEAYKLAKLASNATGVRAALLLAVLDRESALGQNVGRCGYKTAMNPKRDIPIFLALVADLNINPDTVLVSCANADGAYGGAMGPAQFIPSTWDLYKNKVASVTGSNPPSPWKNSDAFVATAVYMRDLLDTCSSYSGLAKERCAAARYYSGRRWSNYLWTYGERVVNKAEQFQKDIDILNS